VRLIFSCIDFRGVSVSNNSHSKWINIQGRDLYNRCRISCISRRFHLLHQPSRRKYLALGRVFHRCLLARCAPWSSIVVIRTPSVTKQLRFLKCRKNLARQQLVAQSGVETFNDPVLLRIAVNSSSTIITSCDFNLRETSSAIFSWVYSSNITNILIGIPLLVRS